MSMYKEIVWNAEPTETKNNGEYKSQKKAVIPAVSDYDFKDPKFPRGHWSFLGPGSQEKWSRNLYSQTR